MFSNIAGFQSDIGFEVERNGCVKISKLRQSCDSFCVHNLQETTFICIIAIENISNTTPIVNNCMLLQLPMLYRRITFVRAAFAACNAKYVKRLS